MGLTSKLEMEFEKVTPPQARIATDPRYLHGFALVLVLLLGFMTIAPLTSRGLDAAVPPPPPPGMTGPK